MKCQDLAQEGIVRVMQRAEWRSLSELRTDDHLVSRREPEIVKPHKLTDAFLDARVLNLVMPVRIDCPICDGLVGARAAELPERDGCDIARSMPAVPAMNVGGTTFRARDRAVEQLEDAPRGGRGERADLKIAQDVRFPARRPAGHASGS